MTNLSDWKNPEYVSVPGDPLKYLYVPSDALEYMVWDISQRILHDLSHMRNDARVLMLGMGGYLPGVLAADHLQWVPEGKNLIFGGTSISTYQGPNDTEGTPKIIENISIDINGKDVLVVEDLIDRGFTLSYLDNMLKETYAVNSVRYYTVFTKNPEVSSRLGATHYTSVAKDVWVIMPRERSETLLKRVPFWLSMGMSLDDCRNILRRIGYPEYMIQHYINRDFFPLV